MSDPTNNAIVTSCKSANLTKVANHVADATLAQETINASGVGVGSNPALGAGATLVSATINSNNMLNANRLLREMQRQISIDVARDAVRGTYLARS